MSVQEIKKIVDQQMEDDEDKTTAFQLHTLLTKLIKATEYCYVQLQFCSADNNWAKSAYCQVIREQKCLQYAL